MVRFRLLKMGVKKALDKLIPLIPERKMLKIESVVASRTKSISILLENVLDTTNEFAIMRSMEILGVYQLHRLKTEPSLALRNHRYPVRTDSGARNWILCKEWASVKKCMTHFKEQGYGLAIAAPNAKLSIEDLDFSKKMVIAFGNEAHGISEELAAYRDVEFSLPMCGFTDSFNVSVAAAITLYHSYIQRTVAGGSGGNLSEEERALLTLKYCRTTLGIADDVKLSGQMAGIEDDLNLLMQ